MQRMWSLERRQLSAKKTIYLLCLFTLVLSLFSCSTILSFYKKFQVQKKLRSIPLEDRLILDSFFRILLFKGGFAYALLGDKPMSGEYYLFECTSLQDDCMIRYNLSRRNILLRNGWNIWQKYSYLFPSKSIIIQHVIKGENGFLNFINKRNVETLFENHKSDFISKYGPSITAKKIVKMCLDETNIGGINYENCHDIVGMLYGFGRHNSFLYQQRDNLEELSIKNNVAELLNLNCTLQLFLDTHPSSLQLLSLPRFVADLSHPETIAIKKKYEKQRKEICEYYRNGDFLELTLRKFVE